MKLVRELKETTPIKMAQDVFNYLKEFQKEDREHFIVIGLNTKNVPLYREIVSLGTLNATIIHPREIFKKAIIMSCSSIIIAHNHPSGDVTPSIEDDKVTQQLIEVGKIIDIKVLDHIIIGKTFYSYSDNDFL